jgi:hypothetical protein
VQRVLEAKADAPDSAEPHPHVDRRAAGLAMQEELRPTGPNPCATIERNVEKARERNLSLDELALFGAGLRRPLKPIIGPRSTCSPAAR